MLVFDRRSLRCVVPPTEDCEVPTTPPPGPGDFLEEEDGEQNIPLPVRPSNQKQNNQQQQSQRRGQEAPNLPPGVIPLPVRNRN